MNWILSHIKKQGKKITDTRIQISEYILTRCVCSAQDIIQALPTMDKVSIYRTIELFESLDIIHPTTVIDGHQYYEVHAATHHHHTQCLHCGAATCTDCPIQAKQTKTHHTLFFTTKSCANCA
jgi:Fe2+ or Zn2+ uptake regulation protein